MKTKTLLIAALMGMGLAGVQAVTPGPTGGYPGNNTAAGDNALFNLDTSQGTNNTAIGWQALYWATTGYYNTAVGMSALHQDTTGYYNVALGITAMYWNTTGFGNTALGSFALINNTTASFNTAVGDDSLFSMQVGQFNVGVGALTLHDATGNNNTALGHASGSSILGGSNNICIGNVGLDVDNGVTRIGQRGLQNQAFIVGVYETKIANGGLPVVVRPNGQLGVVASSKIDELQNQINELKAQVAALQNLVK